MGDYGGPLRRAILAGKDHGRRETAPAFGRMYAAAISEVDGRPPLLKPDTVAEVGQIHSTGYDLVARTHKSFGLGFQAVADAWYPFLGAGAFGHGGAGGSPALPGAPHPPGLPLTTRRHPPPPRGGAAVPTRA